MATEIQETDGKSTKAGKASKRTRDVVAVKIIERKGDSVVFQHGPCRYVGPVSLLAGNDIAKADVEKCTLWGEDWHTWVDESIASDFAEQLWGTGIYTKSDLLARSHEVRAVLQRLLVNDRLAEMLKKARE